MQDLVSPPSGGSVISALGDIGGFQHDDLTVTPQAGMFTNPVFSTTSSLDNAEAYAQVVVRVGYASGRNANGAISNDGGTTWKPFASVPAGAQAGSVADSADGAGVVWTPNNNGVVSVSSDQGAT